MAGARGYQNYRGRTPLWKKLLAVVLVLVILAAAVFLFLQKYLVYDDRGQVRLDLPWQQEETTPPSSGASSDEQGGETDLVIPEPERTQGRAVLLSGDSSGWAQQVTQAKAQGANAFAVTVKDSEGSLHYLSQTGQSVDTLSNDAQASDGAIRSLLTEEDVYAVARVSCFRDSLQARSAVEEMGLKNTGGYIFYDGNNENWLDPAKEAARTYLCEIIQECADLGFDEILLTDVGYPTVGKLNKVDDGGADRTATLATFLKEAAAAVPEGVKLSVELPAETISGTDTETQGLTLTAAAEYADAVYAAVSPEEAAALTETVKTAGCAFVPELTASDDRTGLEEWLLLS